MIPLRTNVDVHRTPWMNYGIIAANVLVYAGGAAFFSREGREQFKDALNLDGALPVWWQFFTYQFLHADAWHVFGNMLFLWVFGNSVNARMGHWAYLMFYLAGGAFAGWGYTLSHQLPMIGASGAVAAVTTAFLVLFPRSRILFLFFFFIITTFELPSLWVIVFKMVLWDNVLAPSLEGGESHVAFAAHLAGHFFGFAAALGMLLVGAMPRHTFDLPSVVRRWFQRRALVEARPGPSYSVGLDAIPTARPIRRDDRPESDQPKSDDRVVELRTKIQENLAQPSPSDAVLDQYDQLMQLDPDQFLPLTHQKEIGKAYYTRRKFVAAAHAFEKVLKHYPQQADLGEVHLLLGIVYARDLSQPEAAQKHLEMAIELLTDASRKEQARMWLAQIQPR